ncbi:MAG: DNA sulfur modification protein DndD, partial [Tannerellaceae bacterium]|nr:DNA sulfur modification protein DndD [Tannerellaceae bacterium]
EQQLYATALLKALVDESEIDFPIFIDSPLQKLDNLHSEKIITEFYPHVAKQVVLFPLIGKELSSEEYRLLMPNISKAYFIDNENQNSTFKEISLNELFQ